MFDSKSKNSVIAKTNTICDNVKLVGMNNMKNLDVVGDGPAVSRVHQGVLRACMILK